MDFFRGRDNEDERITETRYSSNSYGGNGYGRGGRDNERYTETSTTYYDSDNRGPPPPPQVPYPWQARWDERDRRYVFVNEQTGERSFEMPGNGYSGGGYGGGGQERRYESETVTEDSHRRGGGGHGMMYAGLGAAAGLAGGAFLMHESGNIENRFEDDKYRVENDVEVPGRLCDRSGFDTLTHFKDFPENAANWTGRKVGEVEDIPQNIEQGFDRFGNRIEGGFDNAVQDVEDVPEDIAGWTGRKVGDVERFDDNIDNSYDQGRNEGRYDDGDRW